MITDISKVQKQDMIAWFKEHDDWVDSLLAFATLREVERKSEKSRFLIDKATEMRTQAKEYKRLADETLDIEMSIHYLEKATKLQTEATKLDNQESKLWA